MTKEIKKCFRLLNLPYNANLDDLKEKERALIKYYRAKAIKTGVSHDENIAFVRIASEKLYEYISNNKEEYKGLYFETTPTEIGMQLIMLVLNCLCVIMCFIALI